MTDLIKRDDALAAIDAFERDFEQSWRVQFSADIKALPAVTVGVKPLDKFGVRELARAAGISPTTAMRVKRGEGDLDGATLRAVLAATGTCLCCGRQPQPIDPAAIREAALREAAELVRSTAYTNNGDKRSLEPVSIGFEGMDFHHATIADAILALIGENK